MTDEEWIDKLAALLVRAGDDVTDMGCTCVSSQRSHGRACEGVRYGRQYYAAAKKARARKGTGLPKRVENGMRAALSQLLAGEGERGHENEANFPAIHAAWDWLHRSNSLPTPCPSRVLCEHATPGCKPGARCVACLNDAHGECP